MRMKDSQYKNCVINPLNGIHSLVVMQYILYCVPHSHAVCRANVTLIEVSARNSEDNGHLYCSNSSTRLDFV